MRTNIILLVIGCTITISVVGQQNPEGPDLFSRMSDTRQEFTPHKRPVPDSTLFQLFRREPGLRTATLKKSKTEIRQKMDSSHVQRFQDDIGGLATLNRDRYTYDDEGRLILAVTYTCNTWDEQYHWFKDTAAYDSNDDQILKASYTRDVETEPWVLEYRIESSYDARGNDTLSIQSFPDPETGEWLTEKYVTSYEDDLITRVIAYAWDESSSRWERYGKIENVYDAKGNSLAQSTYVWSEETRDWIHCVQVEFTYDTDGNITSYFYYYFNVAAKLWRGWSREEYTYDSDGNMVQYIGYGWSSLEGYWVPQDKELSAYDSRGYQTEFSTFSWDSGTDQWVPGRKSAHVFNTSGNLMEYYRYTWDSGNSQWISLDRELNEYDQNGRLTGYSKYEWNGEDNQWLPVNRILYAYDTNGKNILISIAGWDAAGGAWSESSRSERDYNSDGNLVHTLSLGSKDSSGQWTSKYQYEYTYNTTYTENEILTPYGWSGDVPVNMLTKGEGSRWDPSTDEWYTFKLQEYYYSAFGSSNIPKSRVAIVKVFPNPAEDVLYVETEESAESVRFELRDLQGRTVYAVNLTGLRNEVPVTHLPGGVYVYQVTREGECSYGKVIKK